MSAKDQSKMSWYSLLLVFCLVPQCTVASTTFFRFSTYFSDHMVLQKGTNKEYVWGRSSKIGDTVHLTMKSSQDAHALDAGNTTVDRHGIWMIKITYRIHQNYGPYTIRAMSSLGNVSLHDVLFGDVWICSGQSNMEFFVADLQNSTEELADTNSYQNIRLFRANHAMSNTSLYEFRSIALQWTVPTSGTLNHFSAVCWLYGKYLSEHLNYPLGLVETNWGGTAIEAWSSPQALASCNGNTKRFTRPTASTLWNAMIYPLLRTPIYGVIWYQGESNSNHPDDYTCQFPAMIHDWRMRFAYLTHHATPANFPFGFVQLAANKNSSSHYGFTGVRWAQTAAHGVVPNRDMPNTFMAVAMDLPDFTSPRGSVHPRFKHDVAARLVLSSLAVAYHQTGFDYQGPYPSSYKLAHNTLTIEYSNGREPISIRSHDGFEVCCSIATRNCTHRLGIWKSAPMTSFDTSTVTLSTANCHGNVAAVRYAWEESPCDFKQCPIYGRDNDLPGPPFYHHL